METDTAKAVSAEFTLPRFVTEVITRLEENGHVAYAVGGCVRDMLMGRTPHDYDICTSALPDEIKSVFSDMTTIDTGIKHGTVTVLSDSNPIEITTFRTESSYSDGRHPDSVSFASSLSEDLARRDFTVNAMAYSERCGTVDIFGGADDIKKRIIRCVGDPEERFSEDHLRILRAIRFSATLGFKLENDTSDAVIRLKDTLSTVSPERISAELNKAIMGKDFGRVLTEYSRVFAVFIPELTPCIDYQQNNPHHIYDLLTHTAKAVDACPDDRIVRLAALLHDIGKPMTASVGDDGVSHYFGHARASTEAANAILHRLCYNTADIRDITELIRYHDGYIEPTEKAVKKRLAQLGEKQFFRLITLKRADNAAQTADQSYRKEYAKRIVSIANDILNRKDCLSLKALAINGNDLLALGMTGREIGKALKLMLDAVIDGQVENQREALLSLLDRKYRSVISAE